MSAGISTGGRPDAPEARLGVCQQFIQTQMQYQQQGIPTLYGQSPQFQGLLAEYMKQIEQVQNQEINKNEFGPLGGRAAQMGGLETQGVQDAS